MSTRMVTMALVLTALCGCGQATSVPEAIGSAGHPEPFDQMTHDESEALTMSVAPLVSATAKKTRTIAVLMLDLGNGPPDAASAKNMLMAANTSVRNVYREVSFGMQDLEFDILGPWTLPVKACLTIACCGPSSDQTGNGSTVSKIIADLPKKYDHYLYWYGSSTGASGCSTWGDAGAASRPAVYCSIDWDDVYAVSQEIGHNLGMEHEHTLSCSGSAWADDPSKCTTNEYGSKISFMGTTLGHPSGFHKAYEGWLQGCNVIKASGSGTFNLVPLERACDGVQLLQIPMPKTRNAPRQAVKFYYVELRTPFGFDANVARQPFVAIYAGPEISSASGYAAHTFLISQLTTAGSSFADPAGGLTIKVDSISANGASVSITGPATGTSACLSGGAAFTAPGPDISSCGAGVGGTNGGTGGVTGTGGNAATGGRAGGTGGGAGGASGSGGSGGSAGSAGSQGTGGRAGGTGGSVAGSGGAPTGTGGATGSGGRSTGTGGANVPGTGGSTSVGTGGGLGSGGTTGGATGGASVDAGGVPETGGATGCSCSIANGNKSSSAMILLVAAMILAKRRRG